MIDKQRIVDKMRNRDNLTLVIKMTNSCDSNCKYCFHKYNMIGDENEHMSLELYNEILEKTVPYYSSISVHYHGGEPLMLSEQRLEDFFKITKKFTDNGSKIRCGMQSNILHLTEEKLALLNKYNVSLSTSYDSISNSKNRLVSQNKWLEKYNMYMNYQKNAKANKHLGLIGVITKNTIDNMDLVIEDIESFDEKNSVMSNCMCSFSCKEDDFILKTGDYKTFVIKKFEKQLEKNRYLTSDTSRWIHALLGNPGACQTTYCLNSVLTITPNGYIKGCDMRNEEPFVYGNIKDLDCIKDIYKTKKYMELEKAYLDLNERCSSCEAYNCCKAGCINLSTFCYNENELVLSKQSICEDVKDLVKYFDNFLKKYDYDINKLPDNVKDSIIQRR